MKYIFVDCFTILAIPQYTISGTLRAIEVTSEGTREINKSSL